MLLIKVTFGTVKLPKRKFQSSTTLTPCTMHLGTKKKVGTPASTWLKAYSANRMTFPPARPQRLTMYKL